MTSVLFKRKMNVRVGNGGSTLAAMMAAAGVAPGANPEDIYSLANPTRLMGMFLPFSVHLPRTLYTLSFKKVLHDSLDLLDIERNTVPYVLRCGKPQTAT